MDGREWKGIDGRGTIRTERGRPVITKGRGRKGREWREEERTAWAKLEEDRLEVKKWMGRI